MDMQLIRASEFVRMGARGLLNFDASKGALEDLAAACRKRGVDRALLDLRDLPIPAKPLFTPAQLAALVETFREAGFGRNQRLAVLYREDPHHGARMFAFISALKGWRVKAFADFERALLWLSEGNGLEHERGEQEVPISRQKIEVKRSVKQKQK
jgi:hypothetical protein